jgi:hypothetical protein
MFEQVSPSIARVAGRHGGGGLQMKDQATSAKPIEMTSSNRLQALDI